MERDLAQLVKLVAGSADWIGLREITEEVTILASRSGKVDQTSWQSSQGLMVEVIVDGHLAFGATSSFQTDTIIACVQETVARAQASGPWKIAAFPPDFIRPAFQGHYQGPNQRAIRTEMAGEIYQQLQQITTQLQAGPQVISSHAMAFLVNRSMRYYPTNGANVEQHIPQLFTQFSVTGEQGPVKQTRTSGHQVACGGLEVLERDTQKALAVRLLREVHELLAAPHCPSGKMDLILDPGAMVLQIHESIGHPLELDRMLGDELNYAGHTHVRPEDFGQLMYGSPLLNITFDPTIAQELASYGFDDTGVQAEKQYLIKEGLLLRGLGGRESQWRSKLPGVANMRVDNWNRPVIDRMANINLEAGSSSFTDLVSKVEKGIYLQTNCSWSIDDYRRNFQFGCEYGQLIEDGRLTSVVKNPNYRGISLPFWRSLAAVGDQSTVEVGGSYYCGKGEPNQTVRVGHASPPCLFRGVEVFGGEQNV